MFNGLIRHQAHILNFKNNILSLASSYKPQIGDSISINGACLTVIALNKNGFSVNIAKESLAVLAIERYKDQVHIEPAMSLGERIEGHLIQGHIDCLGMIENITPSNNGVDFYISVAKEYIKFIAPKGAIAIDGVSLTVNAVMKNQFRVTIIKHTLQETLFGTYQTKLRVQIETDMFARYLYHILQNQTLDTNALKQKDMDTITQYF